MLKRLSRIKAALLGVCAFSFAIGAATAQTEIPGCTAQYACNFNPAATVDDGSCEYLSCIGCMNEFACNYDPLAIYPLNNCEFLSCAGCTILEACNYDPEAIVPNLAECDFTSCVGCMDFTACTYDPEATLADPNLCDYPEPDFDCAGNQIGCSGCEPEFVTEISNMSFGCTEELPFEITDVPVAVNNCDGDTLDVTSLVVDLTDDYVVNMGTTADGNGPDGAIRIFGLSALGLSNSDYFIESFPLFVSRYNNGIVIINGQVQNAQNSNLKWNVQIVLEEAMGAEDWLAQNPNNGMIAAYECVIDTASTITYRLASEHSFLIGTGGYEGSYLQLSHMPVNEFKRFQFGQGGNSVNCNYGLGGWFAWSGRVLGETVSGMSGDLIIDLGTDVVSPVTCGNESVVHIHHALNASCGSLTQAFQMFVRNDTVAPTWIGNDCQSNVALCYEVENGSVEIPEPCAFAFDDECGEPPSTSLSETVISGDPDLAGDEPIQIQRIYSATDCSGNTTEFIQTLIFDGTPCPVAPATPGTSERKAAKPAVRTQPLEQTGASLNPQIYPNPTAGTSMLNFRLDSGASAQITVLNLAGQIMARLESAHAVVQLDAHGWQSGCYLVQIQAGQHRETLRWLIKN
jgi:hypothetical protein